MRQTEEEPFVAGVAPILITGVPRSGTTFLGRMIGYEPGIFYLHEPVANHCRAGFFRWWHEKTFPDARGDEAALRAVFARMLRLEFDLKTDWRTHTRTLDRIKSLGWWGKAAWGRRHGERPLLKDPCALLLTEWLHREFGVEPVLMIRHPAAVVHSFLRKGWRFNIEATVRQPHIAEGPAARCAAELRQKNLRGLTPVEEVAFMWRLLASIIVDYRARHPEWMVLRHEDIVVEPAAAVRRVFSHLGLPFRTATEKRIHDFTGGHNPAADLDTSMNIRRDASGVNRLWRDALSADAKAAIREIVAPVFGEFYRDADWD